jgi:hypothetical protein
VADVDRVKRAEKKADFHRAAKVQIVSNTKKQQ